MPPLVIAGAVVAAGAVSAAAISSSSAKKAAKAQQQAAGQATDATLQGQREAIAAEREMFDLTREDLAPYREVGGEALYRLRDLSQPGEYFDQDFDFGMGDFEADPGYQFRLTEGMKALERSSAARGGLLSGRTMKDIQRFGQGLASDEFNRAYTREFNEFQANRSNRFNRLAALAGIGQTATTTGAQIGTQTSNQLANISLATGGNIADINLQAGNAKAGAYAAQGQIWGGALQNISQLPQQYLTLKSLGIS